MPVMRTRGGLLLAAAIGCGPSVSLDDPDPDPSPATTSVPGEASSTGAGSSSDDDAPGSDDGGERLDLGSAFDLPPQPLPPGLCPPDCQFELSRAWTYEGPAARPPDPLDPLDHVRVAAGPRDDVLVAEERQGALELTRLDDSGQELWTLPLALPCDPCHLAGLSAHGTDSALVSGYGTSGAGSPVAVIARVELADPTVAFVSTHPLDEGAGVVPRAGPLVDIGDGRLAQPAIEGSAVAGLERQLLLIYDGHDGALAYADELATGPSSGDGPLPLGTPYANDVLAVGLPTGPSPDDPGQLRWVHAVTNVTQASAALAVAPVALDTTHDGRALALGQVVEPGGVELLVHSGRPDVPAQWTAQLSLRSDSAPLPALAADRLGYAYVATRSAVGQPGRELDTSIEVVRLTGVGEAIWQITLPVRTDYVERPLSLAVRDEETLLVGSFVGGARHVEQRSPTCACD